MHFSLSFFCTEKCRCLPVNAGDNQELWSAPYFILFSSVLKKHLHVLFGQINFSSVFLCFSLITINWQTSYDSGILCQDYRIIRQGSYASGKCQGNLKFFKVRELSGNFIICQGKLNFC